MTQLALLNTKWCVYKPLRPISDPKNHAVDWVDDDGTIVTRRGLLFRGERAEIGRSLRKDCSHCKQLLRYDLEDIDG